MENSSKSNIYVYLICSIGGIFGLHRFYVGKIFTGILQLFTLGGFLIWWMIDLYRIIRARFTDGKGKTIIWKQPEKIEGQHSYAGFWVRLAAFSIDGLVIGLLLIPIIVVIIAYCAALGLKGNDYENAFNLLYNASNYIISIAYYIYHHSSAKQATIGKKIVGIYVITSEGTKLSVLHSVGRSFANILSSLTLGIGFMMAGWTKKKQALHDIVAGTYVVYGKPSDGIIKP